MTIFGLDCSHYNSLSQSGLNSVRDAGIIFFTHKASEGTWMRDNQFGSAINWAANAGIPYLGAYHVVRTDASVSKQVDYFIDAVADRFDWAKYPAWFWQVDLEKWPYDSVDEGLGEQMAELLVERTGRAAILYASKGQYGNSISTSVPLWNANYPTWTNGSCPSHEYRDSYNRSGGDSGPGWATYSGQTPALWQYTSNGYAGQVYGVDCNAFRGTESEFAQLIGADDMHQDEVLEYTTNLNGRTIGNVFADEANMRNYLYAGIEDGPAAGDNYPGANSRLAKLVDAAERILAGANVQLSADQMDRLAEVIVERLRREHAGPYDDEDELTDEPPEGADGDEPGGQAGIPL